MAVQLVQSSKYSQVLENILSDRQAHTHTQTHMHFHTHSGVCTLPGCDKLRYFDRLTRRVHDFCGKTHATKYKNMVQGHQGHGHGQTSSYVGYGYQGYSAAHNYNHGMCNNSVHFLLMHNKFCVYLYCVVT